MYTYHERKDLLRTSTLLRDYSLRHIRTCLHLTLDCDVFEEILQQTSPLNYMDEAFFVTMETTDYKHVCGLTTTNV